MPVITLPDGSQRAFDNPVSVFDVAADIGPGLAKAALAGKIDGREVDTSYMIEDDAELAIITERDEEGLEIIRHSTAHLLAMAVQQLFPGVQVTIGPVIEDGFYYDFAFERPFTPEDLEKIEAEMKKIAKEKHTVTRAVGDRGRIRVEARVEGDVYVVLVGDSGPGVSDDQARRIFEPFWTTRPAGEGTGLGLSISRRFCRMMGGDVEVESKEGAGSTFTVVLPSEVPVSRSARVSDVRWRTDDMIRAITPPWSMRSRTLGV